MKSAVVRDPLRGCWWETYYSTIIIHFSYRLSYITWTLVQSLKYQGLKSMGIRLWIKDFEDSGFLPSLLKSVMGSPKCSFILLAM